MQTLSTSVVFKRQDIVPQQPRGAAAPGQVHRARDLSADTAGRMRAGNLRISDV